RELLHVSAVHGAALAFPPSPLGGGGWGEGRGLAGAFVGSGVVCQELSCACGARVTFSLRGQRESNQRERPPRLALAGHPARQVRETGPGFSSGLLPARKGEVIRGLARCAALSSPPHRRPGAPEEQARIVRARSKGLASSQCFALLWSLLLRAGSALLFRGPYG